MKEKPMKAQTADPYRMKCRDCIYRDQEVLHVDGKKVMIGIMRDTCLIYDGKKANWKPSSVYFLNQECFFYQKDETAERFWEKGEK